MRFLSFYIHIPFCKRQCPYCTFYTVPHDEELERRFVSRAVDEIRSEMEHLRTAPAGKDEPVCLRTVYFGGGSPSILDEESLEMLFDAISPYTDKKLTVETTIELNPEDVRDGYMDLLSELGVDRVSLGVQSMSGGMQEVLGRCDPGVNERAIEEVRSAFDNFNLDVLLGIPGGNTLEVIETLETLLDYSPPHFSVYCLEGEKNSSENLRKFFSMVEEEETASQYIAVCEHLRKKGYLHYEVSNFSLAGRESKHNRAYWEMEEYIGIGPGAHSFLSGIRYSNEPSLEKYVRLEMDELRSSRIVDTLKAEESCVEHLMLGLRTDRGVALGSLSGGGDLIDELIRTGLARRSSGRLLLTDRGYLLLDEIVAELANEAYPGLESLPRRMHTS